MSTLRKVRCCSILLALAAALSCAAAPVKEARPLDLFDRVVAVLAERFHDQEFRENELPRLVERFERRARAARTVADQAAVTHELLAQIPSSHMGLLSETAYRRAMDELAGRPAPTFGFELVEYDGKYFAHAVLDAGPAEEAGVLSGDRIVAIDGVPIEESPRLDWRTDDAYLPDPPIHGLHCEAGDAVTLSIERRPREALETRVPAEDFCALRSTYDGARIIAHEGLQVGYIHLWMIYMTGAPEQLRDKLTGDFADCDALILDLRGRGGNGMAVAGILGCLKGKRAVWNKPVFALVNRLTRSAKEIIAFEMRRQEIATLIGEPTAGAVIPATFAEVGHDMVLMFPSFRLGHYTELIEGKPVQPHVRVADAGPYTAGAQPLIEAALTEAVKACQSPVSNLAD